MQDRAASTTDDDGLDADVVVVGYGPVGMVTAAALGRAGHRVVVLERYAGLYNMPRAASFDDETMRTLDRLGIAEHLLPGLITQPTYEWRNQDGDLLIEQRFADPGRSGWAEWYLMYQPDLETALDAACRSLPGVEVRLSTPVLAVEQDDDAVRLTVGSREEPEVVRARYVVACDGGNSFVRRALGVEQDDYGFSEPWMVCDFDTGGRGDVPRALQFGDPAGPASVIALGTDHQRVSFMLDSVEDFPRESDPATVWGRVARWLQPDQAELIRVATYTFRSLVARSWRVGRVVLVGDAAHQMPPFLGQGMCSGVRDAVNVAFKLDLVLRGLLPEDVLDTVQVEREPHVRAVIEEGIRLGRLQTVRDPEQAAARDSTLLARRAAGSTPQRMPFPDLASGLLAQQPGPGRGSLSVQGRVDAGEGPRLLDRAVGEGSHLLVRPTALPALEAAGLPGALAEAGVRVVALADAPSGVAGVAGVTTVVDVDGTYGAWFSGLGVAAVAVRPDLYVFGTAPEGADAGGPAVALARGLLVALGAGTARVLATTHA